MKNPEASAATASLTWSRYISVVVGKVSTVRFAVAVDNARVVTFFRSLEAAGFQVELLPDELPGPDPRGPLIRFGPLPEPELELTAPPRHLHVGELLIDREARITLRRGQVIDLGRREFDVLATLAEQADHVVDRRALVDMVWGSELVSANTVEVHVSSLRRKLDDGRHRLIDTVRGRGYVLRSQRRVDPRLDVLLAERQSLVEQREAAVARREAILLAKRLDEARRESQTPTAPLDAVSPQTS